MVGGGVVWYLLLCVIGMVSGVPLPGIRATPRRMIAVLVLSAISIYFLFSPLLLALCIPYALYATGAVAWRHRAYKPTVVALVMGLALLVVPATLAAMLHETRRASRMSPAEKIAMWDGTVISRQWMRRLKEQEPQSADEYRKLIRIAPCTYPAKDAATRLAEIGSGREDVRLIFSAVESCDAAGDKYVRGGFAEPLSEMTQLKLEKYAPSSEWRKQLQAGGWLN